MGYFDLATINTAIEETLAAATGITRAQDLEDLTETIPEMDLPLLQVVPSNWSGASRSQTHLNTFAGNGTDTIPMQQKTWVYNAYIYIAPVGRKFSESMVNLVTLAAAVTEALDAQTQAPLFGEEAIRSFQYEAERAIMEYSGVNFHIINVTLTLELW